MNMIIRSKAVLLTAIMLLMVLTAEAANNEKLTSSVSLSPGYWNNVGIKFTNNSGSAVNLNNAVFQFDTPAQLSSVYGDFSAISYPTINLTSTKNGDGTYHNVVSLILPSGSWVISQLAAGKSITLQFGFNSATDASGKPILPASSDIKNITVTLGNQPVNNGSLIVKAPASPGSDVASQTITVTVSGPNFNKTINMAWTSAHTMSNLSYGTYSVTAANVGQYIAPGMQQAVINSGNGVTVTLGAYTKPVPQTATMNVAMPNAPVTGAPDPVVRLQNVTAGTAAQLISSHWSVTSTVNNLVPGNSYKLWADNFSLNSNSYHPNYTQTSPYTFVANATTATNVNISYSSKPLPVSYAVMVSITGLPANASAVQVSLSGTNGNNYVANVTPNIPVAISVLADTYTVTASHYTDSAAQKTYVAASQSVVVNSANVAIPVSYTVQQPGNTVFAPYIDFTLNVKWDNTVGPNGALVPQDLGALSQASGVKNYTLAFIVSGGACTPSWGGSYPVDINYGGKSISNLRAQGGDVIISFGGMAGQELAQTCTNVNSLAAAYKAVVDTYNVKKLDFDIEGAAQLDHAANIRRAQALAQLQAHYPNLQISYTLPVMPYGLVPDGLGVLKDTIGNNNTGAKPTIAYVNIMTMDYGNGTKDMGAAAISAAQATAQQLATFYPNKSNTDLLKMVGVTPMIGMNDVTSEIFTLQNAASVNSFAKQNQLALVSMWSFNRDHQCAGGTSSYVQLTCSSVIQTPYAFSQALGQ